MVMIFYTLSMIKNEFSSVLDRRVPYSGCIHLITKHFGANCTNDDEILGEKKSNAAFLQFFILYLSFLRIEIIDMLTLISRRKKRNFVVYFSLGFSYTTHFIIKIPFSVYVEFINIYK